MRPSAVYGSLQKSGFAIQIVVVVALLCSAVFVASSGMGFKWFFLVCMALTAFAVAMVFPDFRLFIVLLLTACIPIAIQYNVFDHGSKYVIVEHFGGAQNTLMINLVDFPIAALFMVWIADLASGQRILPRWERIDTYIVLMIVFSALSLFSTDEYALLFFEVLRYLKYYLLLWMLRTYLTDRMFVINCLYVVGVVAGFEFLLACVQYFFFFTLPFPVGGVSGSQFDMVNNTVIQRVSGTVGHCNTFAAYLLFPIVVSFVFLIARVGPVIRLVSSVVFITGCIALVLTFSRNAWMTAFVSVGALCLIGIMTKRISPALSLGVFGLAMLALGVLIVSGVAEIILVRVLEDDGKAFDSRWDLIKVAVEMLADQPFFGIGLNSFEEQMSSFDNTGVTNVIQQPVHNVLFLIAAESGLPSLLFFLLICRSVGAHIVALLRRQDEQGFIVGVSVGVVLAALMLSNQFDVTLRKEPIIGMCVLFIAMAMATNRGRLGDGISVSS